MTIIRSVRAKEIVNATKIFFERNGIPLCFTLFSTYCIINLLEIWKYIKNVKDLKYGMVALQYEVKCDRQYLVDLLRPNPEICLVINRAPHVKRRQESAVGYARTNDPTKNECYNEQFL